MSLESRAASMSLAEQNRHSLAARFVGHATQLDASGVAPSRGEGLALASRLRAMSNPEIQVIIGAAEGAIVSAHASPGAQLSGLALAAYREAYRRGMAPPFA